MDGIENSNIERSINEKKMMATDRSERCSDGLNDEAINVPLINYQNEMHAMAAITAQQTNNKTEVDVDNTNLRCDNQIYDNLITFKSVDKSTISSKCLDLIEISKDQLKRTGMMANSYSTTYSSITKMMATNNNPPSPLTDTTSMSSDNYTPIARLIALQSRERQFATELLASPLRLRGGGEQTINNGASGWGSPPQPTASAVGGPTVAQIPAGQTVGTGSQQWGPPGTNPQQQTVQQQWGQTGGRPAGTQPNNVSTDPNSNGNKMNNVPPVGAQLTSANGNVMGVVQQQTWQTQGTNQLSKPNTQPNPGQSGNGQQQQQGTAQPSVTGGQQNVQNNNQTGTSNTPATLQLQASPSSTGNNNPIVPAGLIGGGTSTAAAKNQLEQLNTMREALFSQDGWGCQHVNQDSNWEVPGSPEPMAIKVTTDAAAVAAAAATSGGPPSVWKPNINNGTELWEANLRNGGQPPAPPVQKTPWGHTPSTNLGGTWGEDDDGVDTGNVWTGAASNQTGTIQGGGGPSGGPTTGNTVPVAQWGGQPGGGTSTGMWPPTPTPNTTGGGTVSGPVGGGPSIVPKKDGDWTTPTPAPLVGQPTTGSSGGSGWGDPRNDMRATGGGNGGPPGNSNPMDMRCDPRELRATGTESGMRIMDPRDPQMRGDMRGDPRGISGRLSGNSSEMWGQHHNLTTGHGQMPINKMIGPGGGPVAGGNVSGGSNQWSGTGGPTNGPKDMQQMGQQKSTGWEEPSPPAQRRNMQNFDDGTSLWGQQQVQQPPPQQQQQQQQPPGGRWKDMSDLGRNVIRGVGQASVGGGGGGGGGTTTPLPQSRIGPNGPIKSEMGGWGPASGVVGGPRISWDESHASNWEDKSGGGVKGFGGGNSGGWTNDSAAAAAAAANAAVANAWAAKNLGGNAGGGGQVWPSQDGDLNEPWSNGGPVMKTLIGNKMMSSELIRGSKQFRLLLDMGYKKDELELTLRATNMDFESAVEILNQTRAESWRRNEEHGGGGGNGGVGGFDHSGFPRYGGQPQQSMPFAPNTNPNLLNNMGVGPSANNLNVAALGNMQSALQAQKHMGGGGGPPGGSHNGAGMGGGGAFTPNTAAAAVAANQSAGQPSTQQLRMLVQQIQMAVQAGYLNHQILNQPLAPATLVLLNQLLTHIKQLQMTTANINRGGVNSLQASVTVTKHKQLINNLQNQIAAQQAIYVKQQAAGHSNIGGGGSGGGGGGNVGGGGGLTNAQDYLRGGGPHDAINSLQGTFSDMAINKMMMQEQQGGFHPGTSQSRLNQWKLPALDKDGIGNDSTDFSRAPGTTAKSTMSTANSAMGSLGLQGDGPWSTGRNVTDGWPDTTPDAENKDWPSAQQSPATAFTDLVPEFEPGKPWKGSQIKTIEDDPSITPGSVARSPLSISAAKESDLFATSSKTSPNDIIPLSLSSSTWSFNPSGSHQNFTSVPQPTSTTSELWGAPINKSSRGPPPGLGTNKGCSTGNLMAGNQSMGGAVTSNGWIGSGLSNRVANTASGSNWVPTNNGWFSPWLLLKNLTAQIDGSTLRTLCMQHGPLVHFHLYLNHGIALCKYTSREEANKAQMTLNNCVLGNTTICAETPSDSEVQNILSHLGVPGAPNPTGSGGAAGSTGIGNGGQSWRQGGQQTHPRSTDTWGSGSVWPSANTGGNLWATPLDGSTERGTPSSLNSFLPENLLSSELN